MTLDYVKLEDADSFSSIFLNYINEDPKLKPFYQEFPSLKNFESAIARRKISTEQRNLLFRRLTEQYGALDTSEAVRNNIASITGSKTFTITTGHQLNIFTGPLYFIYKIVSTINTCKKLNEAFPDHHFIPVYWMASEDHDLEEISSIHLFGKKYTWDTDQKGPVGHMKPHSLNSVIDQLPEQTPLFEKAYLDHDSLANAVRYYVNDLFGKYGLLVVDADDHELKASFAPVIKEEILNPKAADLVSETSKKLDELGFKNQAFAREINFFYMEPGIRERIVKDGEVFKVLNTEKTFSADELETLIREKPECFSPNVIMRPLYQETILPNLAYIGGPSELAYWLQLKGVFEHYDAFFPVLLPRNFALLVNKSLGKKMDKLALEGKDLFKDTHALKASYLEAHGSDDINLDGEMSQVKKIFSQLKEKTLKVDGSLEGYVGAEETKVEKIFENIEKRLRKAEEQNNEVAMGQIETLKEKLFPEGHLQERHDNFLNFYLNNPNLIESLGQYLNPFDFRVHVLRD